MFSSSTLLQIDIQTWNLDEIFDTKWLDELYIIIGLRINFKIMIFNVLLKIAFEEEKNMYDFKKEN